MTKPKWKFDYPIWLVFLPVAFTACAEKKAKIAAREVFLSGLIAFSTITAGVVVAPWLAEQMMKFRRIRIFAIRHSLAIVWTGVSIGIALFLLSVALLLLSSSRDILRSGQALVLALGCVVGSVYLRNWHQCLHSPDSNEPVELERQKALLRKGVRIPMLGVLIGIAMEIWFRQQA